MAVRPARLWRKKMLRRGIGRLLTFCILIGAGMCLRPVAAEVAVAHERHVFRIGEDSEAAPGRRDQSRRYGKNSK